jgi:hypothetical protein
MFIKKIIFPVQTAIQKRETFEIALLKAEK